MEQQHAHYIQQSNTKTRHLIKTKNRSSIYQRHSNIYLIPTKVQLENTLSFVQISTLNYSIKHVIIYKRNSIVIDQIRNISYTIPKLP